MKPVKCPNCGNEIAVDENNQYLSCGSCGKRYVNPYYVKKESSNATVEQNEKPKGNWRCVNCKAILPSDDSSPTLTCPVCGRNHKNPSYKPSQPAVVQASVKEEKAQANTVKNSTNNTSDLNWAYCPQCGNSLDLKNGRTEAYCDHCKKTFVVKRTQNGAIHLEERKQTVNVQQNIVNIQQNIVTAPTKVGESKFTGTYGSLLGNRIVNSLISLFTLGFGIPWVICRSYRWEVDHTVIDGRRLKFDGTGGKLIGSWIKWMFLTLITCGIYGLWVPLKKRAWIVEHSHIEGLAGESKFTGGLASFLGLQIVNFFILVFTFGLGVPWVVCRSMKWDSEHQVIDGRRIYFDGKASQLFGNWIKWILLTIITFGIYSVVVPIRKQAWIVKHQSFVGNSGQSMGDSGKPMSNSRKLTDDSNQRKKTGKIVGCVIAVVVVAAIIVACVLVIPAHTTWYTSEGFAYSVDIIEGTCFIRGIKDRTQTDIVIPEEIDGYKVTKIYDNAFSDCTSLTSITIPDSVTTIGNYAFYNCDSLTSIVIPDSVTTIGYSAFNNCDSLTSVTFGENSQLTTIGDWSFANCSSLTSITIPDSVTTIGNYAFYNCDSLTSLTFGENSQLTTIGSYAFDGCSGLTSVVIPDSVTSIGSYAFLNCTSLTSVTFGENSQLPTIGDRAFFSCYSLTSIDIPNSVTTIEPAAFAYCHRLTSVTFGENSQLTTVGYEAFRCTNLTSITIPDGVTTIGDRAFGDCDSLTSIVIPDSVNTIGSSAFDYLCSSLTDVYYTGTKEQWKEISIGLGNELLTDATIHYNYVNE